MEEMAQKYGDRIQFVKFNVDDNKSIPQRYKASSYFGMGKRRKRWLAFTMPPNLVTILNENWEKTISNLNNNSLPKTGFVFERLFLYRYNDGSKSHFQ